MSDVGGRDEASGESVSTTCADCGGDLPSGLPGVPCPECGGTRRNISVTLPTVNVRTVAHVGSVEVGYGEGPRPWHDQWRMAEEGYRRVGHVYRGAVSGNLACEKAVKDFWVACYHVQDHIEKDNAVPAAVRSQVASAVDKSAPLRCCRAGANNYKHARRADGKETARVAAVRTGGDGSSVTVEYVSGSGATTTWDALDLANQAMDAWRSFFGKVDLDPLDVAGGDHARPLQQLCSNTPTLDRRRSGG